MKLFSKKNSKIQKSKVLIVKELKLIKGGNNGVFAFTDRNGNGNKPN